MPHYETKYFQIEETNILGSIKIKSITPINSTTIRIRYNFTSTKYISSCRQETIEINIIDFNREKENIEKYLFLISLPVISMRIMNLVNSILKTNTSPNCCCTEIDQNTFEQQMFLQAL